MEALVYLLSLIYGHVYKSLGSLLLSTVWTIIMYFYIAVLQLAARRVQDIDFLLIL